MSSSASFDTVPSLIVKKVEKTVYVLVRRLDLAAEGTNRKMLSKISMTMHTLSFNEECTSAELELIFRTTLTLLRNIDYIFRLRNHRGTLIIPKGTMAANSRGTPYSLEVALIHQTVSPKERSIVFPEYAELLKTTLNGYLTRIQRMELEMPDLNNKKQYKTERDMQDLDRKIAFLQKRVDEANQIKWQGTLKKNPLW